MAPSDTSDDKGTLTHTRVPAPAKGGRRRVRGPTPSDTPRGIAAPGSQGEGSLSDCTTEEAYDACDLPSYCGRGALVGIEADGPKVKIVPIFCKRWTCPHCGPQKQARWTRILLAGQPERHITLTCKPLARDTPADAAIALKRSWSRFVDHWRRAGHYCEYAWTLQYHRNGWPHLHVLHKGNFVPHHVLSKWMARTMSSPVVYLRHIKDARAAVKDVIRYVQTPLTKSGDQKPAGARIFRSRGYSPTDDPSPEPGDNTVYEWHYSTRTFHAILLGYLSRWGPERVAKLDDGSVVIDTSPAAGNLIDCMDSLAPCADT